jgi:hypothetical protein
MPICGATPADVITNSTPYSNSGNNPAQTSPGLGLIIGRILQWNFCFSRFLL